MHNKDFHILTWNDYSLFVLAFESSQNHFFGDKRIEKHNFHVYIQNNLKKKRGLSFCLVTFFNRVIILIMCFTLIFPNHLI